MRIDLKLLNENATVPTRGSEQAAGYDLYACNEAESVVIKSGETKKIHTGIAVSIPYGYFGAILARSGLATRNGLRPANCLGCIDSDYTGEVIVALHNDSDVDFVICNGMRVAQLVVIPYEKCDFVVCGELNKTERGDGGFGSTGTK